MKISIIIPVYNNTELIKLTLNSVLDQTYENIQIIVVDDCSTDFTYSLIQEHYGHLVELYKTHLNSGPGGARNLGIKKSIGDYILFLDSDDIIDMHTVKSMVGHAVESGSDLLLCGYEKFSSELPKIADPRECINIKRKEIDCFQYIRLHGYAPWGVLIKSDLIEDNVFPENIIAEDIYSTPLILNRAKSIYYIDIKYFKYKVNQDLAITSNTTKHNLAIIHALNLLNEQFSVDDLIISYVNLLLIRHLYMLNVDVNDISIPNTRMGNNYIIREGSFFLKVELYLAFKYAKTNKLIYLKVMKRIRNFKRAFRVRTLLTIRRQLMTRLTTFTHPS